MENTLEAPAPAGQAAAGRVALALARFFVVAPLYPVQHVRSHGVAEQCLGELRALTSGHESTRIEVGRLGFQIQGELVTLEHPQVQRLHKDLAALGIARLEIGEAATASDLHRFVNVTVEARRRLGVAQGLRQLELAELPETVRIVQREFGRRGGDASSAASIQAAVERVLDANDGVAPETQALLRGAMEKLFGDVVETLCDGRITRAPGQPFGRSLDEVLELGVNALRDALEELTSSGGDPTEIQGLFGAAEKALTIAHDQASVEVLLSVLRQSSAEIRRSTEASLEDAAAYELSLEDLRSGIGCYGDEGSPLETLPAGDRRAELSIVLHVLLASPPDPARLAAEERLTTSLARPLEATERTFLEAAVRGLASRESHAGIDAVLPPTLQALRKADRGAHFLASLSGSASPAQLEALWPHLVNELFLGASDGGAKTRQELIGRVAAPEEGVRGDRLERLLGLEALRAQRFAPELFDRPPPQLFPIFSALLARQVAGVPDALLAGFQRHLPPWPGSEALLTFGGITLACRAFLITVLREGDAERASASAEQQARSILAGSLRGRKRADVDAPWLPRAIVALGAIGTAEELPLLREIGRGFRIWPWRRWPAPCRKAAKTALGKAPGDEREISHG